MSDRLSGLRGKSVTVVSVGLSGLLAQVHLAPEDGAEGEHAMAKGQLMVRGKWLLPPYRGATQRTHDSGVTLYLRGGLTGGAAVCGPGASRAASLGGV